MAWNFEYTIRMLDNMGVTEIILPFIIVFTIVFAALQKSKILGKDSKKFNVIIALVMGLAVVIPHVNGMYPPGSDVVEIMNNALPQVSLVAIAFVMIMLILGIIGGEVNFAGTSLGGIAIWISILSVAIIFMGSANVFNATPRWLYWIHDPYLKEIIVFLLVFGIIIGYITKDDSKVKEHKLQDALKDLSSGLFGGKK